MNPSFRLFSSNDIGRLCEMMDQGLGDGKIPGEGGHKAVWEGLFGKVGEKKKILVSDRNVKEWISRKLARERGVVLGEETDYLENWIWRAFKNAMDGARRGADEQTKALLENKQVELLNADVLQQWIIAEIDEIFENHDEIDTDFAPLRTYLYDKRNDGSWESKGSVIRVGLAAHLAKHFLEYELNRPTVEKEHSAGKQEKPGFGKTWAEGADYFTKDKDSDSDKETEKWQRALYRRLFPDTPGWRELTATDESGKNTIWATLPAWANWLREKGLFEACQQRGKTVLFSGAGLSHAHRRLLLDLATNLEVYQVNPCEEYWEDVDNSRKGKAKTWSRQDCQALILKPEDFDKEELPSFPKDPSSPKDNSLLELWGRSTKESFTLWCQENEYDITFPEEREPLSKTLLSRIKTRLKNRTSDDKREDAPGDGSDDSIRIFKAPSRFREVEQLRDNIVALIKNGYSEDDILVLVPDMDNYRPLIHLVFCPTRGGKYGKDLIANVESDAVESSAYLVAVRQLLGLFRENARLGRGEFCRLMRCSCVRDKWGLSDDDVKIWEKWIDSLNVYGSVGENGNDRFSWSWGIRRLLLSECVGAGEFWRADSKGNSDPIVPFRDIDTGNEELLSKFVCAIESLERMMREAQETKPVFEQKRWFEGVLQDWISVSNEDDVESNIKDDFAELLSEFGHQADLRPERKVRAEEFAEHLLLAMNRLKKKQYGKQLGAVRFAKPKSGGIIPHKAIFWLGLDGNVFPGRDDESSLNLLHVKRIVGDMSGVFQARSAFLESILAAEEQFHLFYLGEDPQKQAELNPSATLLEFRDYLSRVMGVPADGDEVDAPLCDVEKSIPLYRKCDSGEGGASAKSTKDKNALPVGDGKAESSKPIVQLREKDLVNWLKNPRTFYFEHIHSLYADREKDISTDDYEPEELSGLRKWNWHHEVAERCWKAIRKKSQPQSALERTTEVLAWEGRRISAAIEKLIPQKIACFDDKSLEILSSANEWTKYSGKRSCEIKVGLENFQIQLESELIFEQKDEVMVVRLVGQDDDSRGCIVREYTTKNKPHAINWAALGDWIDGIVIGLLLRAVGENRPIVFLHMKKDKGGQRFRKEAFQLEADVSGAKKLLASICLHLYDGALFPIEFVEKSVPTQDAASERRITIDQLLQEKLRKLDAQGVQELDDETLGDYSGRHPKPAEIIAPRPDYVNGQWKAVRDIWLQLISVIGKGLVQKG